MSSFPTNTQFLPIIAGGHFNAFGHGGTAFQVTQDEVTAAADGVTPQDGVRRHDQLPDSPLGLFPPYDGYLGTHFGVCGYPGGFGGFDPSPPLTVPIMWAMRATPAIVLASFYLTFAPAMSAPWSSEIADDGGDKAMADAVKAAHAQDLLPIWEQRAFPSSLESLHFANWLQEVVWGRREDRGNTGAAAGSTTTPGGYRVVPVDVRTVLPLEALLHRDAYLRFAGFQIGSEFRSPAYAFLAVNQPHIDPVRGYSRNQNALRDWWRSIQSDKNADRTERKASGIHMMLGVPNVTMQYTDTAGRVQTVTGAEMAQRIADQAARANVFTVPRTMFKKEDIMAKPELAAIEAVTVKPFDWGNIGESLQAHLKRLDRLDVNMVRAWCHGEREGMEAEHGSRADATAHKSGGVLDCEGVRAMLAQQWDDQVGATWQRQNFPQWQGKIRTKPAPLADPVQEYLQEIANTLLANRATGPDAELELDRRALFGRTSLPIRDEKDVAKDRLKLETDQQKKQQMALANANGNSSTGNGIDPRVAKMNARLNRRMNGN